MLLVNCYSDEGQLIKTVQLSPITAPNSNENKRIKSTPPCRSSVFNPSAISPSSRKVKQTLEDTNRKLKILLKIQKEEELRRLDDLIEKWRQVGMDVLEELKRELGGNSEQVQKLQGKEFARYMGINEPKTLKLLFPDDDESDEEKEGEVLIDQIESQGFSRLNSDFFKDDDCFA
jgi:hypothetical protein